MSSSWQKLSEFRIGHVPCSSFRSEQTGLTVLHAEVEGPLCNGYIVIATECESDDGLPHTLEHLVFLGSEDFPYKGVLDKVAFRNLATGTNAYTDTQHTAYTLTTAGKEGMLSLLPVFLDHVVYPVITDAGFVTEVYHIDGEGNDAGVVYSEMQAIENEARSLQYVRVRKLLYPGACGYAAETGGLMADIRTLNVDKIRHYHQEYYRPDNICVIVTGKVAPDEIFESLKDMEAKFMAKNHGKSGKPRPWFTNPIPPLNESVDERLEFPSEEEDTGSVMIAWRGVQWTDFEKVISLTILHAYLTESEVSVLHQEFVEGGESENPVCAAVYIGMVENREAFFYAVFEAVGIEHIDSIHQRLKDTLNKVCSDGIDMDRMASVINRYHVKHLNALEDSAHDTLPYYLIHSFLFGDPDDAKKKLESVFGSSFLLSKTSDDWVALIQETMLDQNSVTVRAFPSASKATEIQESEQKRLSARKEEIGTSGLETLQKKLDEANDTNNLPVPSDVVERFKIPDASRIPFIPVSTAIFPGSEKSDLMEHLNKEESSESNFYLQFDHVPSEFVEIRILLNTDPLSSRLRLYLELYLEAAYSLSVHRNGEVIPYEKVVQELQDLTVTYSNSLGVGGGNFTCGAFSQVAIFTAKCVLNDSEQYPKMVALLRDVIVKGIFSADRLKVAAKNLLADITEQRRVGETLCQGMIREKCYALGGSNHRACNLIRQQRFLTEVSETLDSDPQKVIDELEEFRRILTQPDNIFCQVIADVKKLPSVKKPWIGDSFLPASRGKGNKTPNSISHARKYQQATVENPDGIAQVLSMSAIESSFLFATTKGLPGFGHTDTAPMLVAQELLCAIEGPMWNLIRGLGLAYSFSMYGDADEGMIYFSLSRSSNLPKALAEAKKLVESFNSGESPIEGVMLENAKASVISSIVSREQTNSSCGLQAIMSAMRGTGPGHNQRLLKQVQAVMVEDIKRVLSTYLVKVFQPTLANVTITTNSNKVEEIVSGLQAMGWKIDRKDSIEDFIEK